MILPRFSRSVGTSEPREPAASLRENTILFTLAALQFIGFVDFMIVMPLGPQLLADLGVDARSFSWVVPAHTLAAGLASFLAAPLLVRGSRRLVYIIVATGLLAGTAACGAAGSLPFLLAARCITGAFGGVLGALSLTIVVEMFSAERCGRPDGSQRGPDGDGYVPDHGEHRTTGSRQLHVDELLRATNRHRDGGRTRRNDGRGRRGRATASLRNGGHRGCRGNHLQPLARRSYPTHGLTRRNCRPPATHGSP